MTTLLFVEDDASLRKLYSNRLVEEGYQLVEAVDGLDGLEKAKTHKPDLIVSDIKMPNLDGIELFKSLQKESPEMAAIPYLFLTANVGQIDQVAGLKLGADAYLTKPTKFEVLLANIESRLGSRNRQLALLKTRLESIFEPLIENVEEDVSDNQNFDAVIEYYTEISKSVSKSFIDFNLMEAATFHVKKLEDVSHVSISLANMCPDPETAILGLSELIINGIEHGNLGVGYKLKTQLLKDGVWNEEIDRRQNLPENINKYVKVTAQRTGEGIEFQIQDQGNGFKPDHYLEFEPLRHTDSHGRGIALSKAVVFDELKYENGGSLVEAFIKK